MFIFASDYERISCKSQFVAGVGAGRPSQDAGRCRGACDDWRGDSDGRQRRPHGVAALRDVLSLCLRDAGRCQFCERLLRLQAWQRRRVHAPWPAAGMCHGMGDGLGHAPRTARYHGAGRCGGTASGVYRRVADGRCGCGVRAVLLSLYHETVVSRAGRCAGAGVFRHRARESHLLSLYARGRAHGDMAGTCGFGGLRTGDRHAALGEQLS